MLENLRRETAGVGIAFMDTTNSEAICNVECVLIVEIASLARIAFCAGTIRAPYLNARGVRADAVTLSPDEMAAQFASDIGRLATLPDSRHITFKARYYENHPIGGEIPRISSTAKSRGEGKG